ncbi:DUF3211 domain-containing protein [Metallosphaera tengchongensis]|uniref:DUF3211 domain-containing protein n=1 Tax=Metallosphaera tengchongensis TaxID=1532350 RepID=A0A6N0NQL5_9CREN|nr:DUF3211 domain-containing protein [Metallosphaera tengchongensis]QKQ99163.1 DUF3211 domain-containing protein [Metallosphaera tengchongensis]
MKKSVEVSTSHDTPSLYTVLSDPSFVLPRLFPPIKEVKIDGNSFDANGRFMLMGFHMHGNVIRGEEIIYAFHLSAGGGKGDGRLTVRVGSPVHLTFEYEGWMERTSEIAFMDRWFRDFAEKLDEEVRMERIRRRI